MASVAVTHHDDVGVAVNTGLQYFDIASLVKDKVVAVKPNDTWASERDKTAVTQPDTLKAVLAYLKRFKPKELVVTGGSGAGETDDIFRIVGLMEVIERENVIFFDHNRPPFKEITLRYAPDKDVEGPQKSVMVNPRVLEYETLVVLSQLKVHETATVTLALKNIAMSYPAADYYGHPRGSYLRPHHFFEDMHSFIAAMVKKFPIDLAITVGHPAMIGQGPIGGHTFETGLVIASTDALAADVVGARLLGFDPEGVAQLMEAHALGVGEIEIDKFKFPALSLAEAIKIFTKKAYGREIDIGHA